VGKEMSQVEAQDREAGGQPQPNCNVNSTFNFAVGAIAISLVVLLGYLAVAHWWH
jgi:hypothetical protein